MEADAQCARNFQYCRKAWISVLAERLIKALSAQSGIAGHLRHAPRPGDVPQVFAALEPAARQLEQGDVSMLEMPKSLLGEERAIRENRRVKIALRTARLSTIKTLETFDFSFQPSLDRNRVLTLAQLGFIEFRDVVLASVNYFCRSLELDAEAGKNYYIWHEVKMGKWATKSALHRLDEKTGEEAVKQCKLIQ
jgi:hypothetical protein